MNDAPVEEEPDESLAHPRKPRKRDIFDVATFGLGAYGFLHELLGGQTAERWGILVVSGIMMGLGKSLDVLAQILTAVSNRVER